jgi:hypothetical protein
MDKYGPVESKLRKDHIEMIKKKMSSFEKGKKLEDSEIIRMSAYEDAFRLYLQGQSWKVTEAVIWERLVTFLDPVTKCLQEAFKPIRAFQLSLKWKLRGFGLKCWGVDAYQTNNMTGVVLPDGSLVKYGTWQYRILYFIGRIK